MLRQRRLTDDEHTLQYVAITSEKVLRDPFGDPAMMHAQLAHLAAATELPTVTLQVLPADAGPHASLASGFAVLSFGDLGEPDLAYVEHALGAAHLERTDDVLRARRKFDQLRTMALTPAASMALLREIAAAPRTWRDHAMDVERPAWRTSSFSGDNGGSCVEVAPLPDGVAVRDTKDRTLAPHTYSRTAWAALLAGVRAGEFTA